MSVEQQKDNNATIVAITQQETETDEGKNNRKKAQRYLLVEHLFNTLADRMWLYAAGLLLMEAVARINPNISQITTSSAYGLVLSSVKVFFSPAIGSLIERTSRLKGAIIPLIIQNTSVAISASLLFFILIDDGITLPVWALFTVVTFFSCVAILASVGLINVVSRDWVVEISNEDELTYVNAWLRSIDQATLVLSAGLGGFTIALDQAIGAITIAVFNLIAMVFQGICLYQIYQLVPKLAEKAERKRTTSITITEKAKSKIKAFFDGWILLAKSEVFIPGLVLGILYVNILGLSFPLQGYGRDQCLSEATISIVYIASAVTGFVAPVSFPWLIRNLGLIGTGLGGCFWQIGFILISVFALFLPGSPYMYYPGADSFPQADLNNATLENFWIRCPPGTTPPTSFLSISVILASAVFQRWGVYIFDMITTQLFQVEVDPSKRNRVAAGQYSLNSLFSMALYGLSLIWSSAEEFGNAILLSNGIIIGGYGMYIIWACSKTPVESETNEPIKVPRIKAFNFIRKSDEESGRPSAIKEELTEL